MINVLLFALAFVTAAAPSFAASFTVHSWDLGEKIELTSERNVWTAELDVTLEDGPTHTAAYCVDFDSYISSSTYYVRDVLDAYTSPSPADETLRNFAWAGHVMDNFGFDVDLLTGVGITRVQAITGVQAAIWEGIHFGDGDDIINVDSLSDGARAVFDSIIATEVGAYGPAVVVDLVGHQDQVITGSSPVPEPSAALVFAIGALIMGKAATRKR